MLQRFSGRGAGWKTLLATSAALVLTLGQSGLAFAHSGSQSGSSGNLSGTLYYTRFCSPTGAFSPGCGTDPNNVGSVPFTYNGTSLTLGTTKDIAQVPAADGIIFTNHNNLLIGGQFGGSVYDVNPQTGAYTTVAAGTNAAFMIGMSPDHSTAYIGSVGDGANGQIGVVGLNPTVHAIGTITVTGAAGSAAPDPNVDAIAFANGQAYYTSSLPDAPGDFGEINLQTGVETQLITGLDAAHGMTYDPYTHTLILSGMHEIAQIDPANPTQILSSTTVNLGSGYYDVFDLPWSDGQGQIFAAANDGNLTFVDFSQSGRLASAQVVQTVYVGSSLDDVLGVLNTSSACTSGGSTSGSGSSSEDGGWSSGMSSSDHSGSSSVSSDQSGSKDDSNPGDDQNSGSGSNCGTGCTVQSSSWGGGSSSDSSKSSSSDSSKSSSSDDSQSSGGCSTCSMSSSSSQSSDQSGQSEDKSGDDSGSTCGSGSQGSSDHSGNQGGSDQSGSGTQLSYHSGSGSWFSGFVSRCWNDVTHGSQGSSGQSGNQGGSDQSGGGTQLSYHSGSGSWFSGFVSRCWSGVSQFNW